MSTIHPSHETDGSASHKHKPTKAELEAQAILFGRGTQIAPPPPPPPKKAEPMPLSADVPEPSKIPERMRHRVTYHIRNHPISTRLGVIADRLKLKKIFTKSRLKFISIGLASFVVFALVFNAPMIISQINYLFNPPQVSESVNLPTEAQEVNTTPTPVEIVPPENIVTIPKINSSAPLVMEPSQQESNIQKALQNGVVHYAGTAVPGEVGNVVIVGHSSNDWWEPGNYKFVFALLDKMAVGDKVQINYSSKKYVYEVTETKVVLPNDLSVLNQTSEPTLTLITCTPPGTSWKRLIVVAKQIEPLPSAKVQPQLTDSKAVESVSLPGQVPSFGEQIRTFFGKIIAFFTPGEDANDPASPQSTPKNDSRPRLPEVS